MGAEKREKEERKEGFVVLSNVKLLHMLPQGQMEEEAVCDKQCIVQNYSVIE